ncbi:uncharacterized protein LOC132259075 [Phlebotomus argentipes]|uniref:uncharacterized protein LOC132259075 n=1 Tax=Phlebotomus argentipes TaxID=94469 RepID=UPI0028937831|nr:uncharacterized protein LOC132259075 [Phlebotomus argentipes]
MTRDVNRRIKFYASTLQPNKPPLSPLKVNVPFQTWSSPENKFFATRLRHNDSEVIGLRTGQGLEFYQFNSDYLLEQVTNTSIIARVQDQLFFADLTHQIYQDILHLNDSGLFVYQYNDNQRDYRFLHRHNEFTQPYGWSPHYANSIQLTDLNSDGRDDLLFTGPRGITALSFDVTNNSWKTLLGPEQLIGAQRYANVVCALPSMTPAIVYSSVLTQDAEGKVQWGLVKPTPVIPFSTTTVPSTSTTLTTSVNTAHSPSIRGNDLFPEQIPRQVLPEKPALRWAEQWNDGFLKETVDPASGHAHLNIPLVDIFATTGWKLQLSLSYNSRVTTSDVSGIGWSLPMAQDYIFVDHQGSIFPEDAHYYLMTGSRPQRLRFLSDEKGIRHFQLQQEAEGTQITISYHQSEQRWIIESETEQTIYGKAKHSVVQDALQWSLGWPNWRSIGRDKAHQQPLLIAWYLNMRLDKDSKRMLYYHYEKDKATIAGGKTYDSALRLKGISDDQYLRLNLDYALREKSEYTSHNPVDDEGNIIFPVSLVQSHYLQGYSLTTSSYSQTLSFVYQIKDGKRLLTDIKQRLLSHTEPVLHFTYQTILDNDYQNLLTVANSTTSTHAEPQECRVRAVSALLPSKMESFVNRVTLSASDIERITAYERSFNADQRALIYNETVAIIPGNNKVAYGWQEATRSYHRGNVTNTDRCFNADGTEVLMPPEEKSVEQAANETEPVSNPMLLLDRSGKRLISDFSPYDLAEEMVAYYGFEPYENNQIGIPAANSATNSWRINRARIVKGNFAFVGEHYLELKSTFKNQPSFLEGLFQPRDQETTYLAACWIRCSAALTLDTTVPYLRAIIRTITGQKIIALSAQTKRQIGDWFYLELPLNFQVLRQIYRDYVNYNAITESNSVQPSQEEANLQIVLRVEAPDNQTIDLDHIRFSPITHDFQAAVYNPITDKPTAVIKANGLVTRTIYNRLDQEIASIDEDGNLQEFSSSSRTGKLVPSPRGNIIDSKPNVITLEPENGSYETFDRNSWRTRWKLDNPAVWNVAPGQLWHKQSGKHIIQAATNLFDHKSAAIRCYFALQESGSALSLNWKEIGRLKFTRKSNGFTDLTIPNAQSLIAPLPSAGELIVMLEENYLWIWLDAVLIVDQALPITSSTPWSMFGIEADGKVLVEDLLVMNRPQTTINYYNAFGDKTQEIQLEDATTAQVSEILYDALGRKSITTKTTRVHRNAGQSLLAYRSDFVSNKNTYNQQSVWQTGILQGEVNRLNPSDQGVAYTRTGYAPNPLDQEQNLGLPGPDFSITGRYSTKVSQHSDLAFLDNLFPSNNGYRQRVEHTSNGSLRIFVFDQANNQVAKYVRVPSFDHLLSTYEYDTEKRLIKILPPLYHEKAETDIRLTAWKFGEDHLSPAEKQLQYALASRFVYDKYGHLIRKITPDSGTTEYLYNAAGQKRFMVSLGATNESQKIVYFNYDSNDQLISTGHINRPLSLTALRQHLESTHLPYAIDYQTFDYSDGHFDPLLRGRVKEFITLDEGEVIIEKLHFDALQQVMSKNAILNEATSDSLNNIEKQYAQDKLQKIIYPVAFDGKPLHVVHSYNRLGQLTGLGTPNNPTRYARFTYHATGQLASEQYQQGTSLSFTRNYHYNSPGFLEKISDPFLTEDIAYANKGYGQAGYGDGMIMQATFNANWPVNADGRWFQIHENDLGGNYSAVCVKALKRTGHLSDNGQPMKLYIRDAETALPLVCGGEMGRRMARLVAEKQKPTYYGHRYAYGNHQELTKAKYLIDDVENLTDPLQPDSFAKKIPGLNKQQSQHIWQLLTDADYIITDQQRDDPATAIGRRGESFFRNADLKADLRALNDKYVVYVEPIKRLIISAISRQKTLSLVDFSATFLHWQNLNLASSRLIYNWQQGIANQIGQMLLDKGYLPTQISDFTRCLNSHFITTLHQYTVFIPKIVQTLSHHFSYELGQTAFDVESTKIDANGNHHLFYTGFDRYELAYRDVTNQIDRIELDWPIESRVKQILSMKHDDQGNVIQALHKNIQHIEYHPVSSRTTRIKLTDGRTLRFYYDAQGERVVKRVLNAEGLISQETHYLRDEQGRVLIDRQTKYLDGSTQYVITAYLYGPRGLIGFIRNNNFYNVTTDHSGSVRLVIKDGRVVAAYDYLPYGGLMRSYGNDPQAHISYRYTGQEWDEETGLYNYHARLYDPSIGRFYQPDPKAQYFSPYKYAGNSPISEVDPDGELAFLLISLALGVLGAYLGGAAANDRWNPVEWDFTDPGTYLGIGGGAIAGALLPVGFAASAAAIGGLAGSAAIGVTATVGLGVGGAYLTTAASTGSWDPSKWKWDRPNTWSSLFQGFGAGSGIAGGIGITHNFANSGKVIVYLGNLKALNAIGIGQRAVKGVFLTVSYASAGGLAYYRAGSANDGNFAFWEWDWTNPATWSGLVDGFDTGMGWPQNVMEMSRGVGRLAKNPKKYLFSGQNQLKLKSILKDSKHPLYKATTGVVMAYFMGSSANGDFDITKWNLASFSTYEGVLNGVFFGKDITKSLKYIRDVKVKQPSNAGIHSLRKKINNNWSRTVSRILDFIQMSRLGQKYQNLAENIFTSKTLWISKLNDQPLSIKNQFEKFIQGGFQKWKSGENRPPLELQKLILGETKLTVQEGSELIKWKSEGEETIRKQQEVFPDEEDALFLNCKGSRRRKRGTVPCFIPMEDMKQEHNPELISEFFKSFDEGIARGVDLGDEYKLIQPNTSEDPRYPNGFDPSNPQGFAENLTLLLNKTPNILAPTHEDFFTNLILGSILTMPDMQKTSGKVIYANIETVNLPDSNGHQLFSHKFLKTGFKEGNTLVLKTFIAEDRNLTFGREKGEKGRIHEHVKKWLDGVSKYSEIELNLLNQKFDRGSIYTHIQENVYYIHTDNSLSMRSSSTGKSEYFQNYSNQMKVILQDLIDVIATQKPIRGADRKNSLVQYLENIDIYNTDKVKALQDKIKKIEKVNALTDSELQTIANAAMNSKVETILDKNIIKLAEIALQDTSPRGSPSVKKPKVEITTDDDVISVADTITHETTLSEISSLDINKVEQGIVEFSTDVLKLYYDHKSTFGFDLNSESGFHGFFYGALALNFKNRYNLDVYVERISGRGYADMLLLSRNGPDGNKNWHAIPIIFEFKADSTSAGKATDQVTGTGYLYNLSMRTVAEKAIVIGINSKLDSEIDIYSAITTRKEDIPRIEGFMQELKKITKGVGSANNFETELKHLYYSTSPLAIKGDDHYMSNLILGEILSEKDRKILVQNNGDFRTFVFQEGDKWVMLNVIESSEKRKDKFKFKDIKIEDKIKLPSEISDTSNIIRFDISVNPKSKDGWSSLEPKRSVGKITNASDYYFQGIKQKDVNSNLGKAEYQKINSVDMTNFIGAPDDILKSLSKSLGSIKDIINSESDFQAVLQGLFMGHAVNTADQGIIMKVFPEANLSKEGRSDLIISVLKKEPNGQIHEEGIFVMELKYAKGDDDDAKLGEGNRQVKKYGSNLASVTDLGVYTPIVAVCCQPGIKFKVHDVETIHHPSPRSQPVSIDDILNFPPPPAVGGASSSFLGDTRKRPKPSDRRKRSLGYVRNAKVSAASSGSSKLQFRPFNMIINVLTTVLSFLSINWLSSSKENEDQHLPPSDFLPRSQSSIDQRSLGKTLLESHSEQQSPSNNFPTGPTLLEMGDQWINRTDVNGLLTWGTLLARKWTGYRPKAVTASSYDPSIAIKLNIQAHELVDAFIGDLAIHAQTCGVGKAVSDLLENTDLYTNILETTRRKLAKGQLDGVSDFLFQHVVQQNIRKLATMSTQVQANELLMKVKKALPDLQQQFIQQNSELQNHCEEGQLPYATPKDNTNFVRQETSSMESVNQFSHPDSLVKETQSRTCNIVPNYTDHFKQLC